MTPHEGATVDFHDDAFRMSMTPREVDGHDPSCMWEVLFQAGGRLGGVGMRASLWSGGAAWDGFTRDLRSTTSPYDDGRTASTAQLSSLDEGWRLRIAREALRRPTFGAPRFSPSLRHRVGVEGQAVQMDVTMRIDADVVHRIERSFRLD